MLYTPKLTKHWCEGQIHLVNRPEWAEGEQNRVNMHCNLEKNKKLKDSMVFWSDNSGNLWKKLYVAEANQENYCCSSWKDGLTMPFIGLVLRRADGQPDS
jgi:hypothetical protein